MIRVAFFIDGFNLYHSLRDAAHELGIDEKGTKWLNMHGLCAKLLPRIGQSSSHPGSAEITSVRYYTAIASHRLARDRHVVGRHRRLIKCLQDVGVQVFTAGFKEKWSTCKKCHEEYLGHEEKQTDVALAVDAVRFALKGECDIVVFVTGDTDVIPAIETIREFAPNVEVWNVAPYKRDQMEIEQRAHGSHRLDIDDYTRSQFDDVVTLSDGKKITKPDEW